MIRRGLTLRFKIDCLGLHKSLLSLCTPMTELLLHLILYKYHYLFLKLVIYMNSRRRSTPECHFTASYVLCKWQKKTILFIDSWILKEKSLRSARQVKEKWKTVFLSQSASNLSLPPLLHKANWHILKWNHHGAALPKADQIIQKSRVLSDFFQHWEQTI